MLNSILSLDSWINQIVMPLQTPELTKAMIFITNIASFTVLFILSLILLFILIKKKKNILLFISSMVLGLISYSSLKYLVHRIRPDNMLFETTSKYSFPSGHAAMAAIFFLLVIYSFKDDIKNKLLKYLFIIFNILLILLIGFSRIYLSVHWFTDVIAGFLINQAKCLGKIEERTENIGKSLSNLGNDFKEHMKNN